MTGDISKAEVTGTVPDLLNEDDGGIQKKPATI